MELAKLLTLYRNKTLSVLIILFFLLVASNIYKGQLNALNNLKRQKDARLSRNEVAAKISESEKKLDSYQSVLKKRDINAVLNTINNIAQGCNVVISAIKPGREESGPAYTKYPFELQVSSDSYHNIARFIGKIEGHGEIYFMDSINIRAAESPNAAYKLSANIVISAVEARSAR